MDNRGMDRSHPHRADTAADKSQRVGSREGKGEEERHERREGVGMDSLSGHTQSNNGAEYVQQDLKECGVGVDVWVWECGAV